MKYPIREINNHEFINISGDKSYLFEIEAPDIEQWDESEQEFFYDKIKLNLINLKKEDYCKFYFKNRQVYLNTSSNEPNLFKCNLVESHQGLRPIINQGDFYSDILIKDDYVKVNSQYLRFINLL